MWQVVKKMRRDKKQSCRKESGVLQSWIIRKILGQLSSVEVTTTQVSDHETEGEGESDGSSDTPTE